MINKICVFFNKLDKKTLQNYKKLGYIKEI